ncbi:DUF397 domain-containing protein [Yinghuangia seranimata]|uniref:DUF397 domain-containing protein n=1 Tax=Yinghuangia seranimata TaxID=408067 RepID=UPI00248BB8C4|nr:DUF397 domain-containing protein [Yinghuangia seranimata]MDI2131450.1 DUF397 domain-containing protein [Yinghuangia seranimata]
MTVSATSWVKSTYSGSAENMCVEVAYPSPALVLARDSKIADSPRLGFTGTAWGEFVACLPH